MKEKIIRIIAALTISYVFVLLSISLLFNPYFQGVTLIELIPDPTLLIKGFGISVIMKVLKDENLFKVVLLVWGIGNGLIMYALSKRVNIRSILKVKNTEHQKDVSENDEKSSARLLSTDEMRKELPNWIYDKKENNSCKKGGFCFGKEDVASDKERIYAETDDKHTLLIGATGEGKDRKFFLQSIWNTAKAKESMILSDAKGSLFLTCVPFLKLLGYKIRLINFKDLLKSDRWNILYNVIKAVEDEDFDSAATYAKNIAMILCEKGKKSSGDPLWYESAVATIQALILYVVIEAPDDSQKHLGSVYTLLLEKGQKDPETDVSELEVMFNELPLDHLAKKPFALKKLAGGNTESSINVSVGGYIQMFNSDTAIKLTSKQTFNFIDISEEPTAVFLKIPHSTQSFNELVALFIEQSYSTLIEHAENIGGRLKRRVHYKIPEFGNVPTLPDYSTKLTISREYGIIHNVAVQSLNQIQTKYKEDYKTLLGNFKNIIYLLSNDNETLDYISKRIGSYTKLVETASVNIKEDTKKEQLSLSYSKQDRALKTSEELSRLPEGTAILVSLRRYSAILNCPDITAYQANSDFGLAKKSDDIEADKEKNRQIFLSRMPLYDEFSYESEDINYFIGKEIPEFFEDHEEEKEKSKKIDELLKKADNISLDENKKEKMTMNEAVEDKNIEDQESSSKGMNNQITYNDILSNIDSLLDEDDEEENNKK